MKNIFIAGAVFCCMVFLLCCKKQEVFRTVDYNRITSILSDNYNLSIFSTALNRTAMDEVLQEERGPFTVLVPSDDAFQTAGINDATQLRMRSLEWTSKLTGYHVLNGIYELNRFPYLINQEIRSRGGGRLYVSRWIKEQDTVLTVNGARVVLKDVPASNGRIQIINRVLEPYEHDELANAISANTDVTLFAEALRRSGLMETLRLKGPYTVFAPNNSAMTAQGYTSVQQIKAADPALLKSMCEYHIAQERRFVNDYILATGSSNIGNQRMINTLTVAINLIPDPKVPGNFNGISLLAPGNTAAVNVSRRDILSGNGVLHIIGGVLRMTR